MVVLPDDQSLCRCKTSSAGPICAPLTRSRAREIDPCQRAASGRLDRCAPRARRKALSSLARPGPLRARWILKKSPTLSGPGEVQSGRSDVPRHRTSFRRQGGLPAVHLRRGHSPLTLATSGLISITNTTCFRFRLLYRKCVSSNRAQCLRVGEATSTSIFFTSPFAKRQIMPFAGGCPPRRWATTSASRADGRYLRRPSHETWGKPP